MRTLIQIPYEQIQELAPCARKRKYLALRRCGKLKVYLAEKVVQRPMAAGFGLWAGRDIDGLKYQQDMRAEWDR